MARAPPSARSMRSPFPKEKPGADPRQKRHADREKTVQCRMGKGEVREPPLKADLLDADEIPVLRDDPPVADREDLEEEVPRRNFRGDGHGQLEDLSFLRLHRPLVHGVEPLLFLPPDDTSR